MKRFLSMVAAAAAILCAHAAPVQVATQKWVLERLAAARGDHTAPYAYTATVATNADRSVTYTAPYSSPDIPNAVSMSITFAPTTNRAIRLSRSSIPGISVSRIYYAWDGTNFVNRSDGVFGSIETFTAHDANGAPYTSYRATARDGTRYVYSLRLGVGTFRAEGDEGKRATLSETTVGDRTAAKLKGDASK